MHNKKRWLLVIFTLFIFSSYIGQIKAEGSDLSHEGINKTNLSDGETIDVNVSEFTSIYNEEISGKSKMVDKIFGNEKINFYLDDSLAFGVVTSDGKIIEQYERGIEKPTLKVDIKSKDLQKLIDRNLTIEDALSSGKIKYQGIGFFKRPKFWIINLVQSILLNSEKTKEDKKKCIDSDGPLNADSSYIKGICTDIDGVSYEDSCVSTDSSNPNNPYKYVQDYDCNSEGYCEPKQWACKTISPVNECEYGICVECPGSDSKCTPSSPVTEKGLNVPEPPKIVNP